MLPLGAVAGTLPNTHSGVLIPTLQSGSLKPYPDLSGFDVLEELDAFRENNFAVLVLLP